LFGEGEVEELQFYLHADGLEEFKNTILKKPQKNNKKATDLQFSFENFILL
jgi:hypothetical protein